MDTIIDSIIIWIQLDYGSNYIIDTIIKDQIIFWIQIWIQLLWIQLWIQLLWIQLYNGSNYIMDPTILWIQLRLCKPTILLLWMGNAVSSWSLTGPEK